MCARCIVNYCDLFRTLDLIKDRVRQIRKETVWGKGCGPATVTYKLLPPVLHALAIAKQLFFLFPSVSYTFVQM